MTQFLGRDGIMVTFKITITVLVRINFVFSGVMVRDDQLPQAGHAVKHSRDMWAGAGVERAGQAGEGTQLAPSLWPLLPF